MIKEKPNCPYCNEVCGSNNLKPIYLKKIEYGWKCPQCNQEFYESQETVNLPLKPKPSKPRIVQEGFSRESFKPVIEKR